MFAANLHVVCAAVLTAFVCDRFMYDYLTFFPS